MIKITGGIKIKSGEHNKQLENLLGFKQIKKKTTKSTTKKKVVKKKSANKLKK
jgi:hypothetical protein